MIPVSAAWHDVLSRAVGRTLAPAEFARMVAAQSAAYTGGARTLSAADALAARALFWFPRDLPKAAHAVEELAWAGAIPERPLRILDLGAGLGATSLGAVLALPFTFSVNGFTEKVNAWTAVDSDPAALAMFRRIAEGGRAAGILPDGIAAPQTLVRDLASPEGIGGLGTWDLVLAGLTAVEFTRSLGAETARGAAIAAFAKAALGCVADDGALVLVEPATRPESRALHHARAALLAAGVTVFAPCPHDGACPMLANERDWCHEDVDVPLPPWLEGVARAAGLRWEGLTWSYLVLRKDGRTLRDAVTEARLVRMVSRPLVTKGKTEAQWCGLPGAGRVMELDRTARSAPPPHLRDVSRGSLVGLETPVEAGDRALRLDGVRWRIVRS